MQAILVPDSGEDGGYVAFFDGRSSILVVRYGRISELVYLTLNPNFGRKGFEGEPKQFENYWTPELWARAVVDGDPQVAGIYRTGQYGGVIVGRAIPPGNPEYDNLLAMFQEPG